MYPIARYSRYLKESSRKHATWRLAILLSCSFLAAGQPERSLLQLNSFLSQPDHQSGEPSMPHLLVTCLHTQCVCLLERQMTNMHAHHIKPGCGTSPHSICYPQLFIE